MSNFTEVVSFTIFFRSWMRSSYMHQDTKALKCGNLTEQYDASIKIQPIGEQKQADKELVDAVTT